jgi:hypothetical protein
MSKPKTYAEALDCIDQLEVALKATSAFLEIERFEDEELLALMDEVLAEATSRGLIHKVDTSETEDGPPLSSGEPVEGGHESSSE